MKSGALEALIAEVRTSEIDYFHPTAVEHFITKAFIAGKQVAFSQALHECEQRTKQRNDVADQLGVIIETLMWQANELSG